MDNDGKPQFENAQDIRDRTAAFAVRIVAFCQRLYDQGGVARLMAPQLLNCGTSISAILEEARDNRPKHPRERGLDR